MRHLRDGIRIRLGDDAPGAQAGRAFGRPGWIEDLGGRRCFQRANVLALFGLPPQRDQVPRRSHRQPWDFVFHTKRGHSLRLRLLLRDRQRG